MASLKPRDYTDQENRIAECLSEFGLRYEQQYEFYPYLADFFVAELNMVIEADGVYGHLSKRDKVRDYNLINVHGVQHVLHIKETKKGDIEKVLWQELNKLSNVPTQKPKPLENLE
tara:strand:- start:227 stop:574 length:348 start_codon:yes stop_codon:yes gene_type:complete